MTEQNIEHIFSEAFRNLEADVNPNVWTNIEKSIQSSPPGQVGSGASSALKGAAGIGKIGLKSVILATTGSIALIGALIYFTTVKTDIKPAILPVNTAVEKDALPAANQKSEAAKQVVTSENEVLKTDEQVKPSVITKAIETNSASDKTTSKQETSSALAGNSSIVAKSLKPHENSAKPAAVSGQNPATSTHVASEQAPVAQSELSQEEPAPVFDQIENYLVSDGGNKLGLQNIITPDGDGLNDKLVLNSTGLKSLEMIVFDQSGKQIFRQKSLTIEWDGRLANGVDAPAGYYSYSISAVTLEGKICIARSLLKLNR